MRLFLVVYITYFIGTADAGRAASAGNFNLKSFGARANGGTGNFNVKSFGARANGRTDDSQAFLDAFNAACTSTGAVKLVIPGGTYLLGPVRFQGPCKAVPSFTMQVQGTLKATTDLGKYKSGWVEFSNVDNLTLTGGGTFNGQGEVSWPYNKCPKQQNCKVLPTSLTFLNTTNTVVKGITSVNSKFFHFALLGCQNFHGTGIKITAPENSPNTDGIHLERNSGVTIADSQIGTGDDCVSIGPGNSLVSLMSITCGPGHGISVGSLGKYHNEGNVQGIVVRDSKISGTQNGLRIKTWANSPSSSKASNMTFENIDMMNVGNPIIIDQTYCPFAKCDASASSRVKISDITFKDIKGTSTTPMAVTLQCSRGLPCQNVVLHNVDITVLGGLSANSTCSNVQAEFVGTQNPPPCQ